MSHNQKRIGRGDFATKWPKEESSSAKRQDVADSDSTSSNQRCNMYGDMRLLPKLMLGELVGQIPQWIFAYLTSHQLADRPVFAVGKPGYICKA